MNERDAQSNSANQVLSVSGLNRMAKSLLEDCFPTVMVEGEISNLATPASGHWYLTLKDERAQIRCAMFRNRNMGVRLRPVNGMQVQVRGRLSLYEARGDYQLILDSMQDAGAGALQRAFEELKASLSARGLFDKERKKPLPEHCRHVAVITSATGAVIQDVLTVFRRRFPAMKITLLPVPVQGQDAPGAIVRALETANKRAADLGIDALIVCRGGGSLEDLQAFNEESVALAIAASQLPVVSAVGHETDFSIADFVADMRAPTPSAAAELLSPDQQRFFQILEQQQKRLLQSIQQTISSQRQHVLSLARHLRHPGRRLQEQAQQVDGLEMRLRRALSARLQMHRNRLQQAQGRLMLSSPRHQLKQHRQRNEDLVARLQRAITQQLKHKQAALQQLSRSLDSISPLQTLNRGYSITHSSDGQVLRNHRDARVGDHITTRLADGQILSIIQETKV